jgi:hypothetical protein
VILAAIAVLVVWGLLYLVFREWRARYKARAAYGANQVAPAIDAFAEVVPEGVEADRFMGAGIFFLLWRDAVARTHDMLKTVTASNLLGLAEMRDLRDELDRAAARAREHRDAAVAELAAVWDAMSERGEFLLKDTRSLKADRHPRPAILPSYGADRVAPALDPLSDLAPEGVGADRWRDAVARTRSFVLDVTASRVLSTMRMMDLRQDLDRAVARARAHPGSAVVELGGIWDSLTRLCRSLFSDPDAVLGRHPRPEIFPSR